VLLNRTLLLPRLCAFTSDSGLVPPPPLQYRDRLGRIDSNVLDDNVDGDWCTAEWYFDMQALYNEFGAMVRESSFLEHPRTPSAAKETGGVGPFFIQASSKWQGADARMPHKGQRSFDQQIWNEVHPIKKWYAGLRRTRRSHCWNWET